jgi:hypothetical protein
MPSHQPYNLHFFPFQPIFSKNDNTTESITGDLVEKSAHDDCPDGGLRHGSLCSPGQHSDHSTPISGGDGLATRLPAPPGAGQAQSWSGPQRGRRPGLCPHRGPQGPGGIRYPHRHGGWHQYGLRHRRALRRREFPRGVGADLQRHRLEPNLPRRSLSGKLVFNPEAGRVQEHLQSSPTCWPT